MWITYSWQCCILNPALEFPAYPYREFGGYSQFSNSDQDFLYYYLTKILVVWLDLYVQLQVLSSEMLTIESYRNVNLMRCFPCPDPLLWWNIISSILVGPPTFNFLQPFWVGLILWFNSFVDRNFCWFFNLPNIFKNKMLQFGFLNRFCGSVWAVVFLTIPLGPGFSGGLVVVQGGRDALV